MTKSTIINKKQKTNDDRIKPKRLKRVILATNNALLTIPFPPSFFEGELTNP